MKSLGNQILDIIEEVTCCEYIGKLEVITDDLCEYTDEEWCILKKECCKYCTDEYAEVKCPRVSNKNCILPEKRYTLNLFLNMYMSPMVFYYEGTENGFKEFIREEIKRRRLEKVFRYEVIRELPAIDNECNETEGNWKN